MKIHLSLNVFKDWINKGFVLWLLNLAILLMYNNFVRPYVCVVMCFAMLVNDNVFSTVVYRK